MDKYGIFQWALKMRNTINEYAFTQDGRVNYWNKARAGSIYLIDINLYLIIEYMGK